MIDSENLRTASLYINNQLLSRGLLRDGRDVDFADFGEGGFGTAESASRVIGILNDLIIRRDRDAQQRESLSTAVRNLRAENLKHASDIARLSERCAEAQRRSDIAAASEASLKTQLKSAESAMRGLKDDLARTRGLVAQVRASCATEIRRRDRQIETLKKQVGEAGRARGTRSSSGILSITVTGDGGGEERRSPTRGGNIEDKDYSLRSETNAFLASLAQNLSEENEALLKVVQQAKDQLREMSGWSSEERCDSEVVKFQSWEEMASELGAVMDHLRTILTNPSFVPIEEVIVREEEIDRLKAGWVKMESRWEDAVHLMDGWRKRMAASGRPIGEEDVKMGLHLSPVRVSDVEETRSAREPGLPAVKEESEEEMEDDALMRSPCPPQGLRQVMADEMGGEAEEEEEEEEEEGEEGEGEVEGEGEDPGEDIYDDSDGEASGSDDDDDVVADEYDVEEPNNHAEEAEEAAAAPEDGVRQSVESEPLAAPHQSGPLQNSSSAGNRGPQQSRLRPKPSSSVPTAEKEESHQSIATAATEAAKLASGRITRPLAAAQRQRPNATKTTKPEERLRIASTSSLDEALLSHNVKEADKAADNSRPEGHPPSRSGPTVGAGSKAANLRSNPRRMPVRLAQPRPNGVARPQRTSPSKSAIAAKLAASEKQADAARARLKALRTARTVRKPPSISATEPPKPAAALKKNASTANGSRSASPVKRGAAQQEARQPDKRKRERRVAKASSRRRSTLSPFELQSLISGNVE
ncbi:nima interactive [Trichoderma cornu-damae]|uniref:Nima interactive n=1 Tax=Trichoderma cornu-damae TaxID=654480 RepID=A0A9P8U0Q2_9HYPO|nr:nima interactive [Trichoderma cornu-damae]